MSATLTKRETDFLARVAVYMADGLEIEAAMRRVLDDDQKLLAAVSSPETGPAIKAGLAAQVYHDIKGRDAMARAVMHTKSEGRP